MSEVQTPRTQVHQSCTNCAANVHQEDSALSKNINGNSNCADVQQSGLVYAISQSCKERELSFVLSDGVQEYSLANETSGPRSESVESARNLINARWVSPVRRNAVETPNDADLRKAYQHLESFANGLFSEERSFESNSLILFVIGTYLHTCFSSIPNLWIYSPDEKCRRTLARILRELCFNGVKASEDFSLEGLVTLIQKVQPTLICHQLPEIRSKVFSILFRDQNDISRKTLNADLSTHSLYCPKIMISASPMSPMLRSFTVPLTIHSVPEKDCTSRDFPAIRGSLLALGSKISKFPTGDVPILDHHLTPLDTWFAPIALAKALTQLSVQSKDEESRFAAQLEAYLASMEQWEVHSQFTEILCAVDDFLDHFEYQYQNGFVPLAKLTEFLNEIDTLPEIKTQTLSRFLRQNGLTNPSEKKRPRVQITRSTFSYCVQQTSVRIKRDRLKKMIHPRHKKELTYKWDP